MRLAAIALGIAALVPQARGNTARQGGARGGAQTRVQLDVPYVPTSPAILSAMLNLADVNANDVVYDLGCGDGRIVIAAAKRFGAHGVGIDLDPERIVEARANAVREGVADKV